MDKRIVSHDELRRQFFVQISDIISGDELKEYLNLAQEFLLDKRSLQDYLNKIAPNNRGVSGYINITVPIVIYAWLVFEDYNIGIRSIIELGSC